MANRGFQDGHFEDCHCGTGEHKQYVPGQVQSIAGPTSVGEQVATGGWARSEVPVANAGDMPVLPRNKYMGGSAGTSGVHVTADYPGGPTGP